MHSLFLKIFLWFWAAMMLVGLTLLLMEVQLAEQQTKRWQRMVSDAFAVYADSAADAHEDENAWESKAYLADLEKRTGIRAWLFDTQGREISGHAPRALASPNSGAAGRAVRREMQLLAVQAHSSGRTEFQQLQTVTLAARATPHLNGQHYILVGELPVARFGPWEVEPRVHVTRLLAVLLMAGVVCWSLGRHLTRPITTLQEATRQLAEGDLAVRPGATMAGRRDELAALSHDFDRMAERIETLVQEQSHLVQAQRRLLADVSHELRSPLARLAIALELARDCAGAALHNRCENTFSGASVSTLGDALSHIETETGRLSELINRLLVLARLESGVQELEQKPVELEALVRAVAADADFEARSLQRAVRVTTSETCTTRGTAALLRSALENVVRNALHYTATGTTVEIALQTRDTNASDCLAISGEPVACAVITVRDRGPGVPAAELQDIFRPFYRVTGARSRQSGGEGLGLAITERAVRLHGGDIAAANAPDGGLIITIRLPVSGLPG